MSDYIRLTEAADQISVSRWTLRRWSQEGFLGCPPRIIRSRNNVVFHRTEWDAFVRRHERECERIQREAEARRNRLQQVAS